MQPELLSQEEIDRALRSELPNWTQDGNTLVRSVTAPTFMGGIELVRRVAEAAEELNHHPDVDIRWTTVKFTLSTYTVSGITKYDLRLAGHIDRLVDDL